MANAPNTKTPSILLEAIKFAASVPLETPYEDLTRVALDAGWAWYLRQSSIETTFSGGNLATFMVSFDVLLGKADGADLSAVDTITVQVGGNAGPVSSHARQLAQNSLVYMLFGRLPPAPAPVADPAPAAQPRYEKHDIADVIDSRDEAPAIAVVERRTPDGLPIFVDLFALGARGPDVAAAVLDVIEETLPSITTVAALNALFSANADLVDFFKDLADPQQRQELQAMMGRRKAEIEDAGAVAPRRRSSAAAVN